MSEWVYVGSSRFGRGVFARQKIARGEEILRFTGRMIGLEEALAKGERQCDPLQVGPRLYIDIEAPGVLINHSCAPNCGIKDDGVLVSLADIAPGDELFYDYSTTMDEDCWTLECQCSSARCRRVIGDFRHLPEPLRAQYLRLGIVQSYIVRDGSPATLRGAESKTMRSLPW